MSDVTRTFSMTIDGGQVQAAAYRDIRNPADGSVVGRCPIGTEEHLERALDAAKEAFHGWRTASDAERQGACQRIASTLTSYGRELAVLVTEEQGKPLKGLGSEFELGGCAAWAAYTASLSLPAKVIDNGQGKKIQQLREPIGVVASITPWNWPLLIAVWHILPAIRTGNTVVIKPSPFTPLGTLRMIELISAELPPGVVNSLAVDDAIAAKLSGDSRVGKVAFTGSAVTGRKVMACAALTLKRLTLELGGNDAGIVLPDADLEKIIEPLFWGAFINSGQTCAALKRLYVHESLHDRLCAMLVQYARAIPMGNGLNEASRLGPLQNERQLERVSELVEDAEEHGGTVLLGGERPQGPGYFYPVTLVSEVKNGVRLVDEEQFGPALPIVRYRTVDEAIGMANDSDYGLAGSVWGGNPQLTDSVARRLEAGTVYINQHADIAPNVPFGGIKGSGLGVEFGQEGLEAYTNIKVINAAI